MTRGRRTDRFYDRLVRCNGDFVVFHIDKRARKAVTVTSFLPMFLNSGTISSVTMLGTYEDRRKASVFTSGGRNGEEPGG